MVSNNIRSNASPEACRPAPPADAYLATATVAIPRSALTIAAPPDLLSQRNVEACTGVPPRTYLAHLRRPGFPCPVVREGKLRLVSREAYVGWLLSLADAPPTTAPANDGVDAVLGELGLVRVGGVGK